MSSHAIKYQKLFREFGLDILKIEKENFLGRDYKLPFEDDIEYRVTLGHIITKAEVDDNWSGCLNESEVLEFFKAGRTDLEIKEMLEEYKKEIATVGSIEKIQNEDLRFSVFFDSKVLLTKNKELAHLAVWQNAARYFTILKHSLKCIYEEKSIIEPHDFFYQKKMSHFLDLVDAEITNNTIRRAVDYTYRLYKDSKFFYELQEHLDKKYDSFIESLLKVKVDAKRV